MQLGVLLLELIFLPFVDACADPRFTVRERGSAVLSACWPLSVPALRHGYISQDAEVVRRCQKATPSLDWSDVRAAILVGSPGEFDGLPLARKSAVTDRDESLRVAVVKLAMRQGVPVTDDFFFGPANFWANPTGYDYLRFNLRGVRFAKPSDWCDSGRSRMRLEWSLTKGNPFRCPPSFLGGR